MFCYLLKLTFALTTLFISDIDNLVKFVFDALNGKAYEDDTQITVLTTGKYYSDGVGRTEVTLKFLDTTDHQVT